MYILILTNLLTYYNFAARFFSYTVNNNFDFLQISDFVPETAIKIESMPSGLLEVEWQQPKVVLPTSTNPFDFALDTPLYEVKLVTDILDLFVISQLS